LLCAGLPQFIETSMHLPNDTAAEISGECGGQWVFVQRTADGFCQRLDKEAASRVTIPQELAWRVFTKGIDRVSAGGKSHLMEIAISARRFSTNRYRRVDAWLTGHFCVTVVSENTSAARID